MMGPIYHCRRSSLYVPCMQLTLETLAHLGLSVSNGYLLVLDSNVLYTPHAHSLTMFFIYTSFNILTFGGSLTWPTVSTRPPSRPAPHRCRCSMSVSMSNVGANVRCLVQYMLNSVINIVSFYLRLII